MFNLYAINNKHKSNVKGYWLDKGKLYKDSIHIARYKSRRALERGIKSLFDVGELSAFYTSEGKGYIISNKGKVDVLRHKHIYKRTRLSTQEVKGIIKTFGGATIHKGARGYIIEVYHNNI